MVWHDKGILPTSRATEDLRQPSTHTVPRRPLSIQLHLQVPGDLIVCEVVLTADVYAGSEDDMPENDIEESPFHVSSIVQHTAPFQQVEREVNGLLVILVVEPNTVRGFAWAASRRPTNIKVQCKNNRHLPRDSPRDSPRYYPEIAPRLPQMCPETAAKTASARRLPENSLPRQSPLHYRNTKSIPVEYT
jgi:hypothetical protein